MPLKYQHTILFVDDELSVTKALQRVFHKSGHQILIAQSGQEGLEILKNNSSEALKVSLIISDQRMPGMTGTQFLEKSKEICPNSVRFLLTGQSEMSDIIDAINKGGIHRFFTKPWNSQDLMYQVEQGLEQYELFLENKRLMELTQKQNRQLYEIGKTLDQRVKERSAELIEKNKELSKLNEALEQGLINTVKAFASLTEMQAPFLSGHGQRVSVLSQQIAEEMHLSEQEINQVEIAGMLHDIGKLGSSEKLLKFKENQWSQEDRDKFYKHPEDGQNIVRLINRLDNVGLIIRHHHEKYNGQGFPDKISEDKIPIGSRIIAVADCYDKIVNLSIHLENHIKDFLKERQITQDFLTKESIRTEAAIHHIKQQAFTWYDPDVVKVFLNILKIKGIKSQNEERFMVENLQEGMKLSRSLLTESNRFLLAHNTILTSNLIDQLKEINKKDEIKEVFCIKKE
ncbi:MAG: response regulator [Desulfobacterales bacterium]|nr:response regulator [Desulfobacterales bacterium]MBF0395728.1 response regulator [Desulfobacterales bacterium]